MTKKRPSMKDQIVPKIPLEMMPPVKGKRTHIHTTVRLRIDHWERLKYLSLEKTRLTGKRYGLTELIIEGSNYILNDMGEGKLPH